jgi:uncharacterized protein
MNRLLLFPVLILFFCGCAEQKQKTALEQIEEQGRNVPPPSDLGFPSGNGVIIQYPSPGNYVNDFAHLLLKEERQELDSLIRQFEISTQNQIAIVTFDTVGIPKTEFDQFTLGLANKWGIGQKDKNNGILIALCVRMRRLRIHTGKGIENILTNEATQLIVDSVMIPEIKKGNYFVSFKKGVDQIIDKLK